jgi:DNA modification methylase
MNAWEIREGDALARLREMADGSVQCCVTSPPYWGLRDYGTARWEGGEVSCTHTRPTSAASVASSTLEGGKRTTAQQQEGWKNGACGLCGAVRVDSQLGLEPTPEAYVAAMVSVFREVRRVLRKDGTLWLNLGDSYVANGSGQVPQTECHVGSGLAGPNRDGMTRLAPKNLFGIPWRVAFALQADGWWLRSDIIWAKPNPMPESVRDRPTRSHEYLFLLTKSARYYYDADAIAEPSIHAGRVVEYDGTQKNCAAGDDVNDRRTLIGANGAARIEVAATRNARSVWTIATHPYPEAHFATFPPEIPRRCILAGSRPGDLVLDPFAGAGTTLLVSDRLGRNGIGIELNPDYCALARRRIAEDAPLFSRTAP